MHALLFKRAFPLVVSSSITAACLFGAAGRLDWPGAWVLIGLSLAAGLAASAILWRDPGLTAERRNLKAGKSWDKALVACVVLIGPAATWIVAGLDVRHGRTAGAHGGWLVAGIVAAAVGGAIIVQAMRANRFFSAVVRIQKDRGQTVVTGGPYRHVRHPGYAGMSLFLLATPLILGSWRAFVPALLTFAVSVLRTALEDRTLQNELDGYAAYARTVKYRLLPFLW